MGFFKTSYSIEMMMCIRTNCRSGLRFTDNSQTLTVLMICLRNLSRKWGSILIAVSSQLLMQSDNIIMLCHLISQIILIIVLQLGGLSSNDQHYDDLCKCLPLMQIIVFVILKVHLHKYFYFVSKHTVSGES